MSRIKETLMRISQYFIGGQPTSFVLDEQRAAPEGALGLSAACAYKEMPSDTN
jgi:hypothetical protein